MRTRPWSDVIECVESRSTSERLVIITDQPMMHLARELPCVVEYVPASMDETESASRLDELRKLYGVDAGGADVVAARARRSGTLLRVLLRAFAVTLTAAVAATVALLVIGFSEGWGSSVMVPLAIVLALGVGAAMAAGGVLALRLLGLARSTRQYSKLTSERTALMRPAVGQLSSSLQEYARLARNRAEAGARDRSRPAKTDVTSPTSPTSPTSQTLLVLAFGDSVDVSALSDAVGRLDRGRVVVATDRSDVVPRLARTASVEFVPDASSTSFGTTLARLLEIAVSCGASDVVVWPDVADVFDVNAVDLGDLSAIEALNLIGVASIDRRIETLSDVVDKVGAHAKSIPIETERRASIRAQRDDRLLRTYVDDVYQQAESLQRLYKRLEAPRGLPPMRGWAVSPDLGARLVEMVLDGSVREVLEMGSGTSTVLFAMAFEQVGAGHVTALEHDEHYAEQTVALLTAHGVAHRSTVIVAPLVEREVDGESFRWYDTSELQPDQPVDLLLVDGPPEATGPRSRYPALPLMADLLADEALVILDDGRRDDETIIAEQWGRRADVVDVVQLPMERRPISISFVRSHRPDAVDADGEPNSPTEDT
jgi:predicted O-methyltransferase YrrM